MNHWLFIATVFGMASATSAANAEDRQPADVQPANQENARLRAAKEHVQRLELQAAEGDGEEIELIDRPLLSYADPARVNSNGTLWVWGTSGRPVAFLELFQGAERDAPWVHAVTQTSGQHVVLTIPGVGRWQPPQTQLESPEIADAPSPAEKAPARLRQIKDLARRFTAHEFWDPDNSRFEMRVLVQPVLRYNDLSASIQDGAAFIIAHGTNPETVLLIEAVGPSLKEARWHYTLARSSHAETHIELDGQEVWKCERADPTNNGATRSYWLFTSPVEPASSVKPANEAAPTGNRK